MSRRRIISHAGTNRSPTVVAPFRARRWFFSVRSQAGSLLRILVATALQSTTQQRLRESNGRRLRRRGFDSLSVRLGAKHARTACEVTQPRVHEILTGGNHEISTLNYSNYDADEREDDLVQ
jgi:hypothetical protein